MVHTFLSSAHFDFDFDLTMDPATNKRRDRNEVRDILQMTRIPVQYFGDKTRESKHVCDHISDKFWEERQVHENHE